MDENEDENEDNCASPLRRFVVDGVEAKSARELKVKNRQFYFAAHTLPSQEEEQATAKPATPEAVHEDRMLRVSLQPARRPHPRENVLLRVCGRVVL